MMDMDMARTILMDPASDVYDIEMVFSSWMRDCPREAERFRLIDAMPRTKPTWEFWRYAVDHETNEKHTWVISAGFAVTAWDAEHALITGTGSWLWNAHVIPIEVLRRAKSEEQMRKLIIYAVGESVMIRRMYCSNPPPIGFYWGIDVGGGPGYTPNAKRQGQ